MSISRQNLSVVIVAFKSDHVIHDCIQSIPDQINIIIIENSNDKEFKEKIEKKYNNVKCILSSQNLGMGTGNNLGLSHVNTDYALILNPDVILEKNAVEELINASKKVDAFAILAPLSKDSNFPNYKLNIENEKDVNSDMPFKVESVDGFAIVFNLKKINQLNGFHKLKYFDENFFMYLENDDLCKRLREKEQNIFIVPKSRIKHLGAKAVNSKYIYEIELSRNWHWTWSKFYFNKKHYGFLTAFIKEFPKFLLNVAKYFFNLSMNKKQKKEIYLKRISGFINATLGKTSFYRPNLKN